MPTTAYVQEELLCDYKRPGLPGLSMSLDRSWWECSSIKHPNINSDCEVDSDCPEKNQYCDLGKCNCQPGYQQNMRKSGFCELESSKLNGNTLTEAGESKEPTSEVLFGVLVFSYWCLFQEITKRVRKLSRNKRASKPRRSERLEWPGRLQLWWRMRSTHVIA